MTTSKSSSNQILTSIFPSATTSKFVFASIFFSTNTRFFYHSSVTTNAFLPVVKPIHVFVHKKNFGSVFSFSYHYDHSRMKQISKRSYRRHSTLNNGTEVQDQEEQSADLCLSALTTNTNTMASPMTKRKRKVKNEVPETRGVSYPLNLDLCQDFKQEKQEVTEEHNLKHNTRVRSKPSTTRDTSHSTTKILYSSDLAKIAPENQWKDLHVPPSELRLSATLTNGQCFHWMVVQRDDGDTGKDPIPSATQSFPDIVSNPPSNATTTPSRMGSTLTQKQLSTTKKGSFSSAWGTYNETDWLGVLRISREPDRYIVLTMRETPTTSLYRVLYKDPIDRKNTNTKNTNTNTNHPASTKNPKKKQMLTTHTTDKDDEDAFIETFLRSYFQLHIKLEPLYQDWSLADTNRLRRIAQVIPGVRVIQQDPVECLFSFLCSSNNNIPRITKILLDIRRTFGRKLLDVYQSGHNASLDSSNCKNHQNTLTTLEIYSFPNLLQLMHASEESLRKLGLGYRAKYVIQTRDLLTQLGGEDYLFQLRQCSKVNRHETSLSSNTCHLTNSTVDVDLYDTNVQDQLTQFSGIGKKVADCIALFSLDQSNAIPVDVHVQHIVRRDYDPTVLSTAKSLTPTIYRRVGDLFRRRFGFYAGWAHSLLFVAELPSFRGVLPDDIVADMDEWRLQEQEKKASLKKKDKGGMM